MLFINLTISYWIFSSFILSVYSIPNKIDVGLEHEFYWIKFDAHTSRKAYRLLTESLDGIIQITDLFVEMNAKFQMFYGVIAMLCWVWSKCIIGAQTDEWLHQRKGIQQLGHGSWQFRFSWCFIQFNPGNQFELQAILLFCRAESSLIIEIELCRRTSLIESVEQFISSDHEHE